MTPTKRLSMVFVLAQCALTYPAAAEQWVYRGTYTEASTVKYGVSSKGYIDIDSIRAEGGLIRYWSKDEIMTSDVVKLEKLESYAVNCKRRTMAWTARKIKGTDSSWAWAGVESESVPREKWVFVEAPPGSRGADDMEFVCKSKQSKITAAQSPSDRSKRSSARRTIRTGSGIIVSQEGYVLTNNHVVKDCPSIRVWDPDRGQHASVVVAGDQTNDLSLLKADGRFNSAATFRGTSPIRPGDAVLALGFPLAGLLASEVNVSIGNINAQAGLGNDITKLQISVPVQPGNSGGPLLDEYGNVTGVVVQKLDAIKVWKLTGDIPQNVNFAVKGEIAQLFLGTHKMSVQLGSATKKLEPAEIATRGRAFTVLIECLN